MLVEDGFPVVVAGFLASGGREPEAADILPRLYEVSRDA